jgi:hypothetical protein
LPERFHFVVGDDAVGLGHLGAERDEAGGEDHIGRRRPEDAALAIDHHVTGGGPNDGAEGAANEAAQSGAADLAPDVHANLGRPLVDVRGLVHLRPKKKPPARGRRLSVRERSGQLSSTPRTNGRDSGSGDILAAPSPPR